MLVHPRMSTETSLSRAHSTPACSSPQPASEAPFNSGPEEHDAVALPLPCSMPATVMEVHTGRRGKKMILRAPVGGCPAGQETELFPVLLLMLHQHSGQSSLLILLEEREDHYSGPPPPAFPALLLMTSNLRHIFLLISQCAASGHGNCRLNSHMLTARDFGLEHFGLQAPAPVRPASAQLRKDV